MLWELRVSELRYRAVMEVLDGASVTSVARSFGVSQGTVHVWLGRYAGAMAVDYPLSIRHRDGAVAEVRYNASVYRDADGNVLAVFAAARDVTNQVQEQKKNVEQQAREREQIVDLQQFQRLTVGRELKMTELKKENEFLRGLLAEGAAQSDEDQR